MRHPISSRQKHQHQQGVIIYGVHVHSKALQPLCPCCTSSNVEELFDLNYNAFKCATCEDIFIPEPLNQALLRLRAKEQARDIARQNKWHQEREDFNDRRPDLA